MNSIKLLEPTHRLLFWQRFWSEVRDLRYAYLKYFFDADEGLSEGSDIDLLIEEDALPSWIQRIQAVPEVSHTIQRKTGHACYLRLFFIDGGYLEVDLIYRFQRNGIVFLRADEVLDETRLNQKGIKVPQPAHDFAYISLFYYLNGQQIPDKYRTHFEQLNKLDQLDIQDYLEETYEWALSRAADLFLAEPAETQLILEPGIRTWPENKGWAARARSIRSRRDSLRYQAPVITFSGVDGAGKTTSLDAFQEILEQKYRYRVKRLRQRPGLLPILSALRYGRKEAQQRAADTLPRQGTNQSRFSSLLRFAWYYLDYQIGQWVVYWQYTRRGILVLYDRYYFDYIADSRRANIALNSKLIAWLYKWVHKPDLNFMLYAAPDIILKRKQELDADTIRDLTARYRSTFEQLQAKDNQRTYLCINNLHLQETLNLVEKSLIRHLVDEA